MDIWRILYNLLFIFNFKSVKTNTYARLEPVIRLPSGFGDA